MFVRKLIFNTFNEEGVNIQNSVANIINEWELNLRLEIERPRIIKFGEYITDMNRMLCYVVGEKSEIHKLEKIVKAYTIF